MSKGGSKTTTQSTQIDPAYLSQWNNVYGMANNYASQPYQQYTGQLVAPFNSGQNQAYGASGNNVNSSQGLNSYGLLGSLMGQNAGTIGGTDLSQYMNPYTQNVINSSMALMNQQKQKDIQGLQDQDIASGAYGNDRTGVERANLDAQYGLQAGQLANQMNSQNYQNAQSMAQQDISNRLANTNAQAALANLGIGAGNSAINQLYQIGSGAQQTAQNQDTAAYNQYLEQRDWNKNNANYLANILHMEPYNTTTTNTQTTQNNPLSSLLGAAVLGFTPLGGAGSSSILGGLGGLLGIGNKSTV